MQRVRTVRVALALCVASGAVALTAAAAPARAQPPLPMAVDLGEGSPPQRLLLDESQRAWIRAHPVVRLAPDHDHGPFVFVTDDGRVDGLAVALLRRIEQRTGLHVTLLPARARAEQMALVQQRHADLLLALRPTPERAAYLEFTQPFVNVPMVLATRRTPARASLEQLDARPVAVSEGASVQAHLRARHPRVRWVTVADDTAAVLGVANGRYDAAVLDSASLAFVSRKHRLGDAVVPAAQVDFQQPLAFGVRRDWPELRAILDAGLASLPAAERQALLRYWLAPVEDDAAPPARFPRVTQAAFALLLLGLLIAGWGLLHDSARAAGRGR